MTMRQHVLLVDDEQSMRSALSKALVRTGYFVTTANDAVEALALLADGGHGPVDLLLTDFNLPGLTGLELVDVLRSQGMEFPVLVMSGSPNKTLATEALLKGCAGFVKKPFRLSVLNEHIRKVLGVQAG